LRRWRDKKVIRLSFVRPDQASEHDLAGAQCDANRAVAASSAVATYFYPQISHH
jgi:hypothetical protein